MALDFISVIQPQPSGRGEGGADDSPLQLAGSRPSLGPAPSSGSPDNTKPSLPGLSGPAPDKESESRSPASGELNRSRRLARGSGEVMVPHLDVNLALRQGLV